MASPTHLAGPRPCRPKRPTPSDSYTIIAAATIIGLALGFTSLDPIKMLIWSAVLNGIVAVPIMVAMMLIVTNPAIMQRFRARPWLTFLGWLGTVLMAVAVLALVWTSV
jgi:Mn2+/Fe2+ NRAMP family transporter